MTSNQLKLAASGKAGALFHEGGAEHPAEVFDHNLSYRLSILNTLLGKATAEIYGAENLTSHQWKVMSVICNFSPIPASDILRWVTLDKSAISRAVRKLQALGLIERRLSNSDARITHLLPTRKGLNMNKRIAEQITALQSSLFGSTPDAAVRSLFETFDRLESQLRQRYSVVDE